MVSVPRYSRVPETALTDQCIILDLDHTCGATQNGDRADMEREVPNKPQLMALRRRVYFFTRQNAGEQRGDGTAQFMWGVARPGLKDFLMFCFSYFRQVIVWSAGTRDYVEAMVEALFADVAQPHAVFAREDCVYDEEQGTYIKPLARLFELHPEVAKYAGLSNTCIVDDTAETFVRNAENAIHIPRYLEDSEETPPSLGAMQANDQALEKLKAWYLRAEVVECRDVRRLDKSRIFSSSVAELRAGSKEEIMFI